MVEISLSAFGEELTLNSLDSAFFNNDVRWRLDNIYAPYFASRTFSGEGLVIDIGAGIGSFALLFAKAYPHLRVICFEPDPELFSLLQGNIHRTGVQNVRALPFAVGETADESSVLRPPLKEDSDEETWRAWTKPLLFATFPQARSYIEPLHLTSNDSVPNREFDTVAAEVIAALDPVVVKLTSPRSEQTVLRALKQSRVQHIVGELWSHVDSELVFRPDQPERQFLLRRAGSRMALRRDRPFGKQWRDGLDIVVPMYNTAKHIEACIRSLTSHDRDDIRILVVDDGSTDDSADKVMSRFGHDKRVQVLRKLNGGCASARNHGRRHSTATHIAFVDADDTVDADLFPKLLELARYSSAETVQASFDFLEESDGAEVLRPAYEDELLKDFQRHTLKADCTWFSAPTNLFIEGQPTIWRRVYRRDFLDNRKIYFPEHIRAFDDLIFHILTLHHTHHIPVLDGPRYHYRQHPQQDIKQADERHFYALEMYRMIVKRGLQEGWNDFAPILRSMVNTVNWSMGLLRQDLAPHFLKAAAQLWVYLEKASPIEHRSNACRDVQHGDFMFLVEQQRKTMRSAPDGAAFSYFDSPLMHPALIRQISRA